MYSSHLEVNEESKRKKNMPVLVPSVANELRVSRGPRPHVCPWWFSLGLVRVEGSTRGVVNHKKGSHISRSSPSPIRDLFISPLHLLLAHPLLHLCRLFMYFDLYVPIDPPAIANQPQNASKKGKGKQNAQQTVPSVTYTSAQLASVEARIDLLVHRKCIAQLSSRNFN